MPKTIVVFMDGTSNDSDLADEDLCITNVYKLFCDIEGDGETNPRKDLQLKIHAVNSSVKQIALYIWGIGAEESIDVIQLTQQAVGIGFEDRLLKGYEFITKHYKSSISAAADGGDDEIVLVGYSRGAYTARALADCICVMGLPNGDVGQCQKYWKEYLGLSDKDRLARAASQQSVKVKAVCAFDTVARVGFKDWVGFGGKNFVLGRTFVFDGIYGGIGNVFHAVAGDEKRWLFKPTLWRPQDQQAIKKLTQEVFPGSHGDVGGGYKEGFHSYASNTTYHWMRLKMSDVGVQFKKLDMSARPMKDLPAFPVIHRPWKVFPYSWMGETPRKFPHCIASQVLYQRNGKGAPESNTDKIEIESHAETVSYTWPSVGDGN